MVGGTTIYLLATTEGLQSWQSRRGVMNLVEHFTTLLLWQLKGLSLFEFAPVCVLPLLLLSWLWKRLAPLRPMAGLALTMIAMMLAVLVVVALSSPQDLAVTKMADMRYVLPVLALGPVVVSADDFEPLEPRVDHEVLDHCQKLAGMPPVRRLWDVFFRRVEDLRGSEHSKA